MSISLKSNSDGKNTNKNCIFAELINNIENYKKRKEEKLIKSAQKPFVLLLEKMKEASEKGLSHISDRENNFKWNRYEYFQLYKKWIMESNPNIIVWIDDYCNLRWRKKYFFDSLYIKNVFYFLLFCLILIFLSFFSFFEILTLIVMSYAFYIEFNRVNNNNNN